MAPSGFQPICRSRTYGTTDCYTAATDGRSIELSVMKDMGTSATIEMHYPVTGKAPALPRRSDDVETV